MAADWRQGKWGDIATLEYGRALRQYETDNGPYRVYGTNGPIGRTTSALCNHPGVIIGRKGAYRGVHYSPEPFFVIDTAFYLEPRVPLDYRWAYYALRCEDINGLDTGSAIPSTTRGSFYAINVRLPPLPEQRAIAAILGALDDKIELNRRMSETLEAIARALFKSWFVDFDPIRAKAEGRDPGLPKEIADLFPASLENSELGEIPAGWRVVSIYDGARVTYGAPYSSTLFNDSVVPPLIRIRDLASQHPTVHTEESHPKGYLVQPGEILVGMDGEFRAFTWSGPPAWLNQRVCVFTPLDGYSPQFIKSTIEPQLAAVEATETATTVIHIGKADIDKFRLLRPPDRVLAHFNAASQPLHERFVAARQGCRTLSSLRDALLPKLISGEIRVPQAEALAAAASGAQGGPAPIK